MGRNSVDRRRFLQVAATSAVVPLAWTGRVAARPPASERIALGFIGVGTMGRYHLSSLLNQKDVQVVAVCDVVAERRDDAKRMVESHYGKQKDKGEFKSCAAFTDFRELVARKDIDAVVIATPDHWHAIPCLEAARAGKDIYCEKPLTHHINEGKLLVEAVKKHDVIFQTGSQQRSEFGGLFRKAVEYVRNGRIGKIKTVRIGVGGPAVPCDLPAQKAPEGTDWNLWLGPAPERGYSDVLCPKGIHRHFPAWRNYREYAGGGLADMGAHHFDIAQWALDMDASGPVKIEPPGDKKNSGLRFVYANGIEMFHGGETDCVFVGSDGTIRVSRSKIESDPADILKQSLGEKDWRCYPSNNHHRNWLDCIKSRKQPICTAEIGHRSATICHLANIGYWLRRSLQWDPVKEQFVDDAEANKLLVREPRGPWKYSG